MIIRAKHISLLCLMLIASGCGSNSIGGANDSAWSTYDYKHPVPTGADVSVYDDAYQDNDDNYTAPQSYGCTMDFGQVCE